MTLRVELALSGKAHCAWCDTAITQGSPRVARAFFHAPGDYSRNNGAATGYNPGGLQDEFMHAQCAFQYDTNPRGKPAACTGSCGQRVSPPLRLLSRFGRPGARCTPAVSAPLYYCFPCASAFIQRYRRQLVGHVGIQQAGSKIAWGSSGPFAAAASGGPPPLPKDKASLQACFLFDQPQSSYSHGWGWGSGSGYGPPLLQTARALRQAYVGCFRFDPPQSMEEEQSACDRHAALQGIIGAALEKDRALSRSKSEVPAAWTHRVDASRPPNSKATAASGISGTEKRPREGVPDPKPVAGKVKGENHRSDAEGSSTAPGAPLLCKKLRGSFS